MRDLSTAESIVRVALGPIMATELGECMVDHDELSAAIVQAIFDVADLLDPDEVFDYEIVE